MILDVIREMLGVEEDDGARALVITARRTQGSLWYLVLSLLEQQGVAFGPASRDELKRARARSSHFEWLAAQLAARMNVTVMKGPALASFYPPGVLRPCFDLDLVFDDEATLWSAAEWICDNQRIERIDASVIGGQPWHLVVAMEWESTDPLIDPPYRVELSTAALAGDFATVPVVAKLPADQAVAAMMSIAEERFQRPFMVRDVIDVAMLATATLPPVPDVVAAVEESRRAPEVEELLSYAGEQVPLGPLKPVLHALPPVVQQETQRRAAAPKVAPGEDVAKRLAAGQVAYGYPIGATRWRGGREATLERFSHGHLLHTPVGDFLLTGGTTVTREAYEAAVRVCDKGSEGSS